MKPQFEQEIIFDDDDDDDEVIEDVTLPVRTSRSIIMNKQGSSNNRTLKHSAELHPLRNFRPLEDPVAAQDAASKLETFLEDTEADDDKYISLNVIEKQSSSSLSQQSIRNFQSLSQNQSIRNFQMTNTIVNTPTTIPPSRSFDPYASPNRSSTAKSLLDTSDESIEEGQQDVVSTSKSTTTRNVPGSAGFLEMEEEPIREDSSNRINNNTATNEYDGYYNDEPIKTSSGLLLTHRKTPYPTTAQPSRKFMNEIPSGSNQYNRNSHSSIPLGYAQNNIPSSSSSNRVPSFHILASKVLRYVRAWVLLSALILFAGTGVLLRHSMAKASGSPETVTTKKLSQDDNIIVSEQDTGGIISLNNGNIQIIPLIQQLEDVPEKVVLLPLPTYDERHRRLEHVSTADKGAMVGVQAFPEDELSVEELMQKPIGLPHLPSPLPNLKADFEAWMGKHGKSYKTEHEKHHRFQIWSYNHHRTAAKNERHGPCKLTGETVFGSNHFQDLTEEEFQAQYLTGYHLKREPIKRGEEPTLPVLGEHDVNTPTPKWHPKVHERFLKHQQRHRKLGYSSGCKWYDISCLLRYIFSTYLYGIGGTMEPAYDADSFPMAVDWRDIGAVTEVHSQGNCGACWAITAVETIESAYFIAKGDLYDLAETEVIVCEQECEMCAGGWPQNAFEYVMDNGGLPLEENMSYDGDWLLLISSSVAGESDELDEQSVKDYQQQTCPAGGGGGHSGDSGDAIEGTNTYARYGKIEGYGYSTPKCVCYTDGSGCDCDDQNEGYAVRNVATYGPAVVCLDASTWQDYNGGVITADSGCSAGFMDVNHCVQVVGYAFSDAVDEAEAERSASGSGSDDHDVDRDRDLGSNSGSGSGDNHSGSGSRDNGQRNGYWIVRNQWSSYWGMNGYAYVAMGENTCGILNDMLQAYA